MNLPPELDPLLIAAVKHRRENPPPAAPRIWMPKLWTPSGEIDFRAEAGNPMPTKAQLRERAFAHISERFGGEPRRTRRRIARDLAKRWRKELLAVHHRRTA